MHGNGAAKRLHRSIDLDVAAGTRRLNGNEAVVSSERTVNMNESVRLERYRCRFGRGTLIAGGTGRCGLNNRDRSARVDDDGAIRGVQVLVRGTTQLNRV